MQNYKADPMEDYCEIWTEEKHCETVEVEVQVYFYSTIKNNLC